LETPILLLNSGAVISSNTKGDRNAGAILVSANEVELFDGSEISSSSTGHGGAGSITIGAEGGVHPTRRVVLSDSTISTSADEGPEIIPGEDPSQTELRREGNITINASDLVLLDHGTITASVVEGLGGSIQIGDPKSTVPKAVVLREASQILAEATGDVEEAQGGRIEITADVFLKSLDSEVSADAGAGVDGIVNINSPEVDVESGLNPLTTEFLGATALMRASCAAQATGGDTGSFTVARHRGLPASPEGLLLAFGELAPGAASGEIAAEEEDELPAVAAAPDPSSSGSAETIQLAQASFSKAATAFRGGDYDAAGERLERASELYAEAGDIEGRSEALRGLGESQQALGRYGESVASLQTALELAQASGESARIASILGSLGNAYLALGDAERAEEALTGSVALAREAGDDALAARLLHNLGNLKASQREYPSALSAYEQSAALAKQARRPAAEARALTSAGRAALEAGEIERATAHLGQAKLRGASVPLTHDKAAIAIHLGKSYKRLAALAPAHRRASLLAAFEALAGAVEVANKLREPLILSYALGNLGALYEEEQRTEEALYLTRQAIRAAQQANAAESLYGWHWQEGRLLWAQGNASGALASYRRSLEILEEMRPETRAQYGSAALHFRRAVAPVYLDFVDALMQGSGMLGDPEASTRLLVEARAVMEQLKAAELRDYFRDECVAEIESQARPLETVSRSATVVYPILLPDRLELLVSLPSGLVRHTVPVTGEQVAAEVAAFQKGLVRPTRSGYRPAAQTLYDWLVRPYAARLEAENVDTLVFVPDGPLRTIPMSALHDGEDFLVSRYAVAITPGLSLVDPKPLDLERAKLLLVGLSEPTQGFPGIPNAARELAAIRELYGGEVLLDEAFETERFKRKLVAEQPSVVHVASHASFTGDPATSFLLTHDDQLTMDEISEMVAPTQFQTQPLELLVLSACETAAGDERAALGLAGVAIRAGAKSALGSLWRIQDEATYELVVGFYEEFKDPAVSKAEALRRAQLRMLESRRFAHPFYWSGFLLISNWL
jgi:CHAT domain-containing protein